MFLLPSAVDVCTMGLENDEAAAVPLVDGDVRTLMVLFPKVPPVRLVKLRVGFELAVAICTLVVLMAVVLVPSAVAALGCMLPSDGP